MLLRNLSASVEDLVRRPAAAGPRPEPAIRSAVHDGCPQVPPPPREPGPEPARPDRPIVGASHLEPHFVTTSMVTDLVTRADGLPDIRETAHPNYVHVSNLVDLCPRRDALTAGRDRDVRNLSSSLQVTFAIGRGLEQHVVRSVIIGSDAVFGYWRCLCERVSYTGLRPGTNVVCPVCRSRPARYHQLLLADHNLWIEGRPDLVMSVDGGKLLPVEVKSISGSRFRELRAAHANHALQALLYRHLLWASGYEVDELAVVFYVSKQHTWQESPYREYHVRPEVWREELDLALSMARQRREAIGGGALPPRTQCQSPTCPRARSCPVAGECFNRGD